MRPFLTLHHPAAARRYYTQGSWRDETLYALLAKHAGECGGAFAARDGERRLTWSQMLEWVDRLAASLAEAGIAAGDRVSMWTDNKLEAVALFQIGRASCRERV